MSPTEKKLLADHLASLDRNERGKLTKRAAQLRKVSISKRPLRPSSRQIEDEDAPGYIKKQKSLEEFMWQIVAAESEQPATEVRGEKFQIVSIVKNSFQAILNGETITCRPKSPSLEAVAVGDFVYVEVTGGEWFVTGICPRRTSLSRPDVANSNRQRVIAANLDLVVVVVSVISPPLHPRLIDRYLLAIRHGGCEAVIVVNKLDLTDEQTRAEELAKLEPYRSIGIPIFECVAHTGDGIAKLRGHLHGSLAAFVGHSGVGKSSLINAFDPRLEQTVGSLSEGYGRGAHTTTRSSLIDLGDLRVIDTPGIRSFGLWEIRQEDLPEYFPDFAQAPRCRFGDCTHVHEPGCSVKMEVRSGNISKDRYETYLRIRESLQSP